MESRPSWVVPTACVTRGVSAYTFHASNVISDLDIQALESLGLSVVADVYVRPAGVVPGGWDGEGAAEWLAGEDVIIAISSNRSISKCVLTVDGAVKWLDWPSGESKIFVGLSALDIGTHNVEVFLLLPEAVDTPVSSGSLLVSVRAAQARPSTGTIREGLMLLANPAVPTLSDVWDGRAPTWTLSGHLVLRWRSLPFFSGDEASSLPATE